MVMTQDICSTGTQGRATCNKVYCSLSFSVFVLLLLLTVYKITRSTGKPVDFGLFPADLRDSTGTSFRKNCTFTTGPGTFDVSRVPDRLRGRRLPFPRLIHRTWKDENVPERWNEGVTSCYEKNVDFGYCHWTDAELERFIAATYPWFVDTYRNYAYPIQRIDAVRYFLLLQYGGIYLDLDYTCKAPLESSLTVYSDFEVVLAETTPTGVTNGFMSSTSDHPFWRYVVRNLADADRWYVVPYATVMFSTGPMYLTRSLERYRESGLPGRIGVIPKEKLADEVLGHLVGNSWHRWDAKVAIVFYRWRFVIFALLGAAGLVLLVALVWCYRVQIVDLIKHCLRNGIKVLNNIVKVKT